MSRPTFTSALAPTLRSFTETRQALGYGDRYIVDNLAHFDRYLTARSWTLAYLTRDVVEDWVASNAALKPRTRALRLRRWRL